MALRTQVKEDVFLEAKKPNVSLFSQLKKEHLIAGMAGGAVSTLCLHPLDLIKIRFAVNEGVAVANVSRPKYNGIIHAFRTIFGSQGVQGLYQGVTPNMYGATAAWGLYFFFYNAVKGWFQDGDSRKDLGPGMHLAIASNAGVWTLAVTNPIWVVKTRMCLQYSSSTTTPHYSGVADALAKIYKNEGIRGWYKGFVPGLFGVTHGALQFMAYEELKTTYNMYKGTPLDKRLESWEYLGFAALSKIFAVITTYPYQVLRARLQEQHRHYDGVIDVIRKISQNEGWRGFYKGMGPNLLRVTPATGITFVVYESIVSFMTSKKT